MDILFFESKIAEGNLDRFIHAVEAGFRPVALSELERLRLLLNNKPALRRGVREMISWHKKDYPFADLMIFDGLASRTVGKEWNEATHPQLMISVDPVFEGHYCSEQNNQCDCGIMLVTPMNKHRVANAIA